MKDLLQIIGAYHNVLDGGREAANIGGGGLELGK
jgi:hypothetical protein